MINELDLLEYKVRTSYRLEVNEAGEITGWYCGCKYAAYKDILTGRCKSCDYTRPFKLNDTVTATIKRRGLEDYWFNNMPMNDDQKELHAKFFADEKTAYKALDFDARRLHRATLEKICFEAKARLSAIDNVEREENAQLHPTQREWLRNSTKNPNPNVTDAITNVRERKQRMSKADRLLAEMKSLGIAEADDLIANVEKKAVKSKMDGITFNMGRKSGIKYSEFCRIENHDLCPGKFRIGELSHECKCKCHEPIQNAPPIDFDNFLG